MKREHEMTFFKRDTKTDDHGHKKAGRLPRVIAGLIAACVLAVTALPGVVPGSIALADEPYTAGNSLPGIEGGAGYMMEANTGVCLYSYNGDQRMNPASTTKILTALLVIEHCTDYQEVITFSHESVNNISWDSSKIGAQEGEQMTVEQVMYGLFLKSGNDAAYALAEYVSGTMEEFAELMTRRAAELGCTGSHFANPHGLTDEEHYTTAHDLAVILRECVRHPEFMQFAGADYYYIERTNQNPDGYIWYTSNKLLNDSYETYDERVIASKTGFTDEAGNCLVTAAQVGDMTLLVTVMGCHDTHYSDTATLLNYGFDHFAVHNMNPDVGDGSADHAMFGSWRRLIRDSDLSIDAESAYVLLPKEADVSEVATQIIPETEDPNDDVIANIVYTYGDRTVGQSAVRLDTSAVGSAVRMLERAQGRSFTDETADAAEGGAGRGDAGSGDSGSAAVPARGPAGIGMKPIIALVVVLAVLAAIVIAMAARNRMNKKPSKLVYGPKVKHAAGAAETPEERRVRRDPDGAPLRGRAIRKDQQIHATHAVPGTPGGRRRTADMEEKRRRTMNTSGHDPKPHRQLTPEEQKRRAAAREEAQRRAAARTAAQKRAREQEQEHRQSEARKNARTRAHIEESRRKNEEPQRGGSYENRPARRPEGLTGTSGLSSDLVNERLRRRAEREDRGRDKE